MKALIDRLWAYSLTETNNSVEDCMSDECHCYRKDLRQSARFKPFFASVVYCCRHSRQLSVVIREQWLPQVMVSWQTVVREFIAELVGIFILLFVGFSGCTLPIIIPMTTKLRYEDCGREACLNGSSLLPRGMTAHRLEIGNIFLLVIALAFGAGICGAILIAGHITG